MPIGDDRFTSACKRIDAANAEDPTTVTIRGQDGPKELLHSRLVTEWVDDLSDEPSEALHLAARGHHFRRWTVPRSSYPTGRAGYLRWRRDLHQRHATELGEILRDVGYDDATIERVGVIVRKRDLSDTETQTLEDALCLVFLETQLTDLAAKLDEDKLRTVLAKTLVKMSPAGRQSIDTLALDDRARQILRDAT